MAITKDMIIAEVLGEHQELVPVFMNSGLHCLGCAMAHGESIEEACMVHGLVEEQMNKLLEVVNEEANREFGEGEAAQ